MSAQINIKINGRIVLATSPVMLLIRMVMDGDISLHDGDMIECEFLSIDDCGTRSTTSKEYISSGMMNK